MQPITKTNLKIYFFFLAVTFAFYGITYKAGFTSDFMGWVQDYDSYSFKAVINSEPYKFKSIYHFTHLLMYAMTYLFRMSGLPWFLVFSGLYALNAFFLFNIFNRLFQESRVENGFWIAMTGVLFFMLSPYQPEVMVWRASFHYLIGFAMMLGIIQLALKYYDTNQTKYFYAALGIFICSAFSIEYFLFTPAIVFLFLIFKDKLKEKKETGKTKILSQFKTSNYRLPIVLCVVVAGYFVLHYFMFGRLFAHGRTGSSVNFISLNGTSTYGKYLFKELFFTRHLEHANKEALIKFFEKTEVAIFIIILVSAIVASSLFCFEKFSAKAKFIFLNFLLYSLLLLPVLPVSFNWIQYSKNDRYGYFPSAFLFIGLSLALSYLPKKFYYTVSCVYLLFSSYLLIKSNRIWMKSERVVSAVSYKFHNWDAKEIYVLSEPENYLGMDMFSEWSDTSGIVVASEVYQKKKFAGNAYGILQYNMTTPTDGVNVKQIASDTLLVTFNQWGNWWWKKGLGASNYETADYKVILDFNNCGRCYALVLKNKNPDRVYLYQDGDELKEFKVK